MRLSRCDRTAAHHAAKARRHSRNLREVPGVNPRVVPMKIFPAIHYSMGGLWADYVKNQKTGGLVEKAPKNHMTNVTGLYAIGEADYQYHGANRLGANSLLSCIFTGLFVRLVSPTTSPPR
ncbi:MAG: FAD-binding protein [Phycisphaerae bacterium]